MSLNLKEDGMLEGEGPQLPSGLSVIGGSENDIFVLQSLSFLCVTGVKYRASSSSKDTRLKSETTFRLLCHASHIHVTIHL